MKKFTSFAVAFLLCSVSFSQNVERITIKGEELNEFYDKEQYKYPQFISSHIYLKNGDTAVGKLNYNFFDQTMRYINGKKDTVVIANEKDISYITVKSDTFFYDNGFYEWGASSGKARLAVKHIYRLVERKTIGAFGTSSPAKNIQNIDKILGASSYNLGQNEELVFAKETTYYISLIKGLKNDFVQVNKKNLSDLDEMFPKKNVEDFVKENKLNLNKEEDVLDLFIYLNQK
jgi:hypothetical protein